MHRMLQHIFLSETYKYPFNGFLKVLLEFHTQTTLTADKLYDLKNYMHSTVVLQ